MSYIELIILALSLSFDTFAVSIGGGTLLPDIKPADKIRIMLFFALFQAGFLFAGWFIGGKFAHIITNWDHWMAFTLLGYIGGKMIYGSLKSCDCAEKERDAACMLQTRKLVVLSIATSIDAVAVGISLAFINLTLHKMCYATLITALITAAACYTGLAGGRKLGCYIGRRAEMIGGVILIFIGAKILIDHLS